MNSTELRDLIQDCNINFLIGAGMSSPYLELLGDIETLLDELSTRQLSRTIRQVVEASLYQRYFVGVINRNLELLAEPTSAGEVFKNYVHFLQTCNTILLLRRSTILTKHVNLFTTNADILLETALDSLRLEYNDGFSGRFHPTFSIGNFGKFYFRRSFHFENVSEIPVFNVLKLHGSLTWSLQGNSPRIGLSSELDTVKATSEKLLPEHLTIPVAHPCTLDQLIESARRVPYRRAVEHFLSSYRKLMIVNPTKEKFADTLFNQAYYDLLRYYSNELEKENTVLFVMGFSFRDSHIRELTIRVADANPTLTVIVFAYTSESKQNLDELLGVATAKNKNIRVLSPNELIPMTSSEQRPQVQQLDFSLVNKKVFDPLLDLIDTKGDRV